VENQLLLTLIGLSPLITSHPKLMQQLRVRSYLLTCSELDRLASGLINLTFCFFKSLPYSIIFKLAKLINSLVHYAKGTL